MSKGGSETATQTNTPSGKVWDAQVKNYEDAVALSNRPYTAYGGEQLAPINWNQAHGIAQVKDQYGFAQMQAGSNAAQGAANYQAPQVSAPSYDPAMRGVMNTHAASAGNATPWTVSNVHAESAGPAAMAEAARMAAAQAGAIERAQAGLMGPAAQMTAANLNRGTVRDVTAGQFTDANIQKYMSPYTNEVVHNTMADLSRQNDIVNNSTNARAAAAGAFGGSRQAVANSLNNEAYLRESASASGNLRNAAFNNAAGLITNDQNRALQAAQGNQQVDYNVGALNTSNQQAASLANTQFTNAQKQFDAGQTQQNNQYNAGAANARQEFDANLRQDANKTNAGWQQQTNLSNQAATNARAEYDTTNRQNAGVINAGAHNSAAAQQAANANNMAQFNANLSQSALTNSANAHNTALADQANARNQAGQYNADLNLRAQLANQSASQNAINTNLSAANSLNGMGLDQQKWNLTNANANLQAGNMLQGQQQRELDLAQQRWAAEQQHPYEQLAMRQQALSGMPISTTLTSTNPTYNNYGANALSGALGGYKLASELGYGNYGTAAAAAGGLLSFL